MPSAAETRRIIDAAAGGDAASAAQLLPLVYDELRTLARSRMAREPVGHTLQPTALVHEAYLRLLGDQDVGWASRGHFFGAAARAMRRILIERARRVATVKHGGRARRVGLDPDALSGDLGGPERSGEWLALDEALTRLEAVAPRQAEVVMLRYFVGLTIEETGSALDVSPATVKNDWTFARAWLLAEMHDDDARRP